MTERNHDTEPQESDDTDSAYIGINGPTATGLDLGGIFSNEFSNITPFYTSPNGPIEVHTATRYGKRYILKGLKQQFRENPIYSMCLAKEFEIGMSLDHPNIRRTIGLEDTESLGRVIVLEYVDGNTLENLIATRSLTTAAARAIARQTADALAYIHSKQVYHRDLKPANVLVSHSGNVVKIIDFSLSDSGDFIILKNPSGSRRYMPPEQLSPDARPSAVADIYSYGVLIGELADATGDAQLSQTAGKCTEADPSRRPQSMEFVHLPSPEPSLAERFSAFLSSPVLTVILLCICAALAVLIAVLLTDNTHNYG